jgi:hypothetical protein
MTSRRGCFMWGFLVAALGVLTALPFPAGATGCSNESFRSGSSEYLTDCRAYELVSPPESNGRFLAPPSTFGIAVAGFDLFPTELISPSGESVVYMTYVSPLKSPKEPTGALDLYQAQRSPGSWQTTRRVTPSGSQSVGPTPGGFSVDHAYAFVNPKGTSEIFPEGPAGSLAEKGPSSYLSKPDGSFEFTAKGSLGREPYGQGRYISAGGEHVIFSTGHDPAQSVWCSAPAAECKVMQLEPNAPPEGTGAVYDRSADGPTRVVSLLPGGKIPLANEQTFYQGVSKDGTAVAFTIDGVLYVRLTNAAKTVEVAEGEPTYAGLSESGEFIYYLLDGNIHRFNTGSEVDAQINSSEDAQIVNVSGDGSHAYFTSPSKLDGTEGFEGQPNLYVWSEEPVRYITTVASSDLERTSGTGVNIPALTRWTSHAVAPQSNPQLGVVGPGADSSRSTPDGKALIFESKAKLTSYENAGHTEIYRYSDSDKSLQCLSCNLTVSSASRDARLQELDLVIAPIVLHNLSDDGRRVFFETPEALVSRDLDSVNDIYEWHEEEDGGASVNLISSGQSLKYGETPAIPSSNVLFSITPSGNDVLFLSQDALLPAAGAGGVPALYDARVGGGLAEPEAPLVCFKEECRSAPLSQSYPVSLPTETTNGKGNLKPRKHPGKHRCRRRRHQKQRHCRKTKRKRHSYEAAASTEPQVEVPDSAATRWVSDPVSHATWRNEGSRAFSPMTLAGSDFSEFGIAAAHAEESTTAASSPPDLTTLLVLNHFFDEEGKPKAKAQVENVTLELPPGLTGNPNAFLRCSTGQLIAAECPIKSQVGIAKVLVTGFGKLTEPIYNLAPPHPEHEIARLGFTGYIYPIFIGVKVRSSDDYGVTATVEDSPGVKTLLEAETTLWGNPADPSHDEERLTPAEAIQCIATGTACEAESEGVKGKRPSGIPLSDRKAFMTNPSACQEGKVDFSVTSYQLPGQLFTALAPLAPITDCTGLPFAPTFSADPTSHVAGAPTGLKTTLVLPQHLGEEERATATMREARVTLPAGMQIAAGAANWIGTCSDAQVGFHKELDTACPDASKLGTATIISPDLPEPIEGTIYQRDPTPGHQFGLWLTADSLGLHIKLPGELEPDKATGRLTAVFPDLPQVPVEEIDLDVWGGPRAPLQNPDRCGTFTTDFSFSPHSDDPAVSGQSQMQITEGCNQGFSPSLHAGVTDPVAGKFSPFVFDLTRDDGNQALRGFELHLPDGELAKLAGVPLCPDAAAASGSCPAGSRIGSLTATTGPGPDPFTLPEPGKPQPQIYLSGPYQGAPFSIVSEVPAQAGPFDLGILAVRSGLQVDPETARATVKADPLPQFFEGVGIAYRHLHAVIDRPDFSLNPTDCREEAVTSDVTSTQDTVAHPSARFQVDGCKALKFKPRLSLKLKGGTRRADYPALTAVLKARKGDANIAFTSVALPHSEFLAQEHIGTVCTRVQFAADRCPRRSVYGKAKATTPLLDKPLEGPVYLRSSDHPLPDLVVALRGQLEIDLVGRIDSVNGGIRTTIAQVPDAPVSRFVLQMKGGAKGLLVNSTDICRGKHKVSVAMRAQNGRAKNSRPLIAAGGCGKPAGRHKHHR